jgi:23S rRNA (cytosine1962-C5)-methyltransferase
VNDLLGDIAPPGAKRIAVRLTPDAERQVRSRHPWVFDASIASISHEGESGDLAVVFDSDRQFLAIGLYDPASPIRVKLLHHGKPVAIDDVFWRASLGAAMDRRAELADGRVTNGYRMVHGENDGMPGLILDRYDSTFVLKLYTTAWLPHLAAIVPVIEELMRPETLILRWARSAKPPTDFGNGAPLIGRRPTAPVLFKENGLTFEADVVSGQKTGHFLDQRDNRNRVRMLSQDKRVLDVFAATGGFSVYAAAGGAAEVHSVDMSAPTLDVVGRNIGHNRHDLDVQHTRFHASVGDAFEVMQRLIDGGEKYDIVIVDPPSFASRRDQINRGLVSYKRLAALAVRLIKPGGLLVQCSCSSRIGADDFFEAVHEGARSAGARLRERERTAHGLDHPIGFREGAYLKALFAVVV